MAYYKLKRAKIFFRVHKNINIVNDVFKTSPIITYLISGNITDSNAYDTKIYKHSEGFKLDSGTGVIEVNQEGTVTISWPDLPLNNLSDDVKFKISKKYMMIQEIRFKRVYFLNMIM